MTVPTRSATLFRTAGITLALAAGLAACKQAPPPPEPVRAVKVVEVGSSAYGTAPEFAGEVKARVESRLGFRVAGKITRRQAEVGQHVQPGAVLAQLDPKAAKKVRFVLPETSMLEDVRMADAGNIKALR